MDNNIFSSRGYDDAWTNYKILDKWDLYTEGFKKAGFYLINDIINNINSDERATDIDEVIYPICFLFRHYVEIRIKSIFVEYYGDDKTNKIIKSCSHGLEDMWRYLEKIYRDKYGKDIKEENIEQIKSYILEFNSSDPNSFAFRYPTTKKGDESLKLSRISYSNLKEKMEYLSNCLDNLYWRFFNLNISDNECKK